MSFRNNAYATMWNIDKTKQEVVKIYDKYADICITTERKKNGVYEKDFGGIVRCIGSAFQKISSKQLCERDRIRLLDVEVTNKYDKEKNAKYYYFICYDLEIMERREYRAREPEVIETDLPNLEDIENKLPF